MLVVVKTKNILSIWTTCVKTVLYSMVHIPEIEFNEHLKELMPNSYQQRTNYLTEQQNPITKHNLWSEYNNFDSNNL